MENIENEQSEAGVDCVCSGWIKASRKATGAIIV